jgi:hypothetical protein
MAVADRLGIDQDKAEALAAELDDPGSGLARVLRIKGREGLDLELIVQPTADADNH